MKPFIAVVLFGVTCGMLAACHSTNSAPASTAPVCTASPEADVAVVEMYRRDQAEQAVIRQHVLYPYHFVTGSPTLNAIGHRDLATMARHFAQAPGSLSLRRGDASESLYDRRAATVLAAMTDAGVYDVTIVDELPGGDGIGSDHVLLILERQREGYGEKSIGSSKSTASDGSTTTND